MFHLPPLYKSTLGGKLRWRGGLWHNSISTRQDIWAASVQEHWTLQSVTELIIHFSHQFMRRKQESTAARGRGSLQASPTLGEGWRATSPTGGWWKKKKKKKQIWLKHFQSCVILVRVQRRPLWTPGGPPNSAEVTSKSPTSMLADSIDSKWNNSCMPPKWAADIFT